MTSGTDVEIRHSCVSSTEATDIAPNTVPDDYASNDIEYKFTTTTFKKISRLPFHDPYRGNPDFIWRRSWNHERITNEAKALVLISQQTTIPVPKLLDHGKYPDGRRYLVTEFIHGLTLKEIGKRGCSRSQGEKHTGDTPCIACSDQAYSNALGFITDIVLPQLARLKSQERGIDGFVMPPSWLTPDAELPWKEKKDWRVLPLEEPEYIFQHGDIAAQNIIMDPQSLQVKALIDWEYAGYFPPGMERWPGTLDPDAYLKRRRNLAQAIAKFLPEEYLECYKCCREKEALSKLVEDGELPNPEELGNQ